MAEEEVDVEGDFDLKSSLDVSSLYDVNEPPSTSACLLPEYTQHPWLLDQSWSLDHGMDDRSKAAIEKMLQEEQYYTGGRGTTRRLSGNDSSPATSPTRKAKEPKVTQNSSHSSPGKSSKTTNRKYWTEEEKQLFEQLFPVFGKNWSSMSESIPGKTAQQVKSYGHQYIRKQKELESLSEPENTDDKEASMRKTLGDLATGQPTVRNASIHAKNPRSIQNKSMKKPGKLGKLKWNDKSLKAKTNKEKGNLNIIDDKKNGLVISDSEVVRINRNSTGDEDSDAEVDISDISDGDLADGVEKSDDVYRQLIAAAQLEETGPVEEPKESSDISCETKDPTLTQRVQAPDECEDQRLQGQTAIAETLSEGVEKHADIKKETAVDGEECNDNAAEDKPQIKQGGSSVISTDELCEEEPAKVNTEPAVADDGDSAAVEEPLQNSFAIQKSNGEYECLPNPEHEVIIDPGGISDQEREFLSEFFVGRKSRTPDRYLKIRNHLIDSWEKVKPNYLNKTSVRSSLRNCGDVNCIGRVHAYLEQIGAINFGCAQAQYNRSVRPAVQRILTQKVAPATSPKKHMTLYPRKRRVRDMYGQWVDEQELEGRTIEHTEMQKKARQKTPRSSRSYDPFKLLHCEEFSKENVAPFRVDVEASALIVMDIHSHLSKTEVIGMLGGSYDAVSQQLHITQARPCDSISTGMQCEMDPVSQTVACEHISGVGQQVVGWYHSHPTFAPNPSVRDVETQLKYQDWFSQGGSHFVGMIVSPYNQDNNHSQSQVQCLTIQMDKDATPPKGIPYQFDFGVTYSQWDSYHVLEHVAELAQKYSAAPNHVEILHHIKSTANITCLVKMLHSIRTLLPGEEEESTEICQNIQDIFQKSYAVNQHNTQNEEPHIES